MHARITVEEVKAAYETVGIKPVEGAFWLNQEYRDEDGGLCVNHCGCPATVVAIARQDDPQRTLVDIKTGARYASDVARETFDSDYLEAFTAAVDGFHVSDTIGGDDGLAVRAALWPEPANA